MNKKSDSLPMYGVGPIYVAVIMVFTVVGICLGLNGILNFSEPPIVHIISAVLGTILIVAGVFLWYSAVITSKVDVSITTNHLLTTGVYSWVRNPIYSAFLFFCTGAILISGNVFLLVLPTFYWLYMTILMKATEEKWLEAAFGDEYISYKKRVNRCLPFPSKEH